MIETIAAIDLSRNWHNDTSGDRTFAPKHSMRWQAIPPRPTRRGMSDPIFAASDEGKTREDTSEKFATMRPGPDVTCHVREHGSCNAVAYE